MISFTVPGQPVPKQRARTLKSGISYTPKKTRDAEALPHESGCPVWDDDESDQMLSDYQECACRNRAILAALGEK